MDVYRWALLAQPGERVVYHKTWDKSLTLPDIRSILRGAMGASDMGLVFLAQRRVRLGRYAGGLQYEATRVSKGIARKLKIEPPLGLGFQDVQLRSNAFNEAMG